MKYNLIFRNYLFERVTEKEMKIIFHKRLIYLFENKSYRENRTGEGTISIPWFTSQIAAITRAGPG